MEEITETITTYKCEICGHSYKEKGEAKSCESKKVTSDKGVKKGDRVKVLTGDGKGETATVEKVFVIDKYYGHYAWKMYWHTIALIVNFKNGGARVLLFNDYEPV